MWEVSWVWIVLVPLAPPKRQKSCGRSAKCCSGWVGALLVLALIGLAIWLGGKWGDVSVMTGHTINAYLVSKPLSSFFSLPLSHMWIVRYGSKSYSEHYENDCRGQDCKEEEHDSDCRGKDCKEEEHDSDCRGKDCKEQEHHKTEDGMSVPGTCSNSSKQCDGIQNCQQAADETNCGENTFYSKEAYNQM